MSDEVKEIVEEVKEVEDKGNDVGKETVEKVEDKKENIKTKTKRDKSIPEYKLKAVEDLKKDLESAKTILLASTNGLPGGQYHEIKKKLRGKADIKVAKKSLLFRAIDGSDKKGLQQLKENIKADVALFFSDLDAFELSGILSDNQSPVRAKGGDISPEDIKIEPGSTELMPGPAISELSGVGLKVSVEDGKIAIKKGATVVKQGEEISEALAGVLGKLGIVPMKAGFEPLSAYDSQTDKVYVGIKIDKELALEELRSAIGKGFGFAVGQGIVNDQTVKYFIAKAGLEAGALERLEPKAEDQSSSEPSEDDAPKGDEEVKEEKNEDNSDSPNENNDNPESENSANDQEQESKEVLDNNPESENSANNQEQESKEVLDNTETKEDNK